MIRTEDEIRAEIERLRELPLASTAANWNRVMTETRIAALEWVIADEQPRETGK